MTVEILKTNQLCINDYSKCAFNEYYVHHGVITYHEFVLIQLYFTT